MAEWEGSGERASERGRKFSLFALLPPSPHYFLSLPLYLVPTPLPEKSCDEIVGVGVGTVKNETQARLVEIPF